jgi:MerR family transcriptional regulator, copper efflux regulator
VSNSYKINETAQRSGFSVATLRYYDDIGLVRAASRTESGYRMYDDRSLDRLGFITRAKQLGCSLEETGELLVAWDGGQCGPVQDQLRSLVAAKAADAQHQIAALTTLRSELAAAASALEGHRPDGPCDDSCGCVSTPAPGAVARASVSLIAKPSRAAADVPIVCTATAESALRTLHAWQALFDRDATSRVAIESGVRVEFASSVDVRELARLASVEQDCCRFFSFAITIDQRGVGLEIAGPADALPVVYALVGMSSVAVTLGERVRR